MITLKQAVIVEGKYDKIKLSELLDAIIITTEGFGIYKNPEKLELIRLMARTNGIIILTDSDRAGFKIRGYLKGCINSGNITNVYIPKIAGKERRKTAPSSEGLLGVEGISEEALLAAFKAAGITADTAPPKQRFLDKYRMADDGLIGRENSAILRRRLLKELNLPENLSANAAVDIINTAFCEQEYIDALKKATEQPKG